MAQLLSLYVIENSGTFFASVFQDKIIFPKEVHACPPPLATAKSRSEGCNKTFVEDFNGMIPCQDDLDCPENEEWFNENGCKGQRKEIISVGSCVTSFDCTGEKCRFRNRYEFFGGPSHPVKFTFQVRVSSISM